jgi:hypothetical protein
MAEPSSTPSARLFITQYEVDLRLGQLGVPREALEQAVREGDLQRRLCTADDFPAAPGFYAWSRTYRILNQEMRRANGWHRGTFLRIPACISPDASIAIAVSSGNAPTGRDDGTPRTNKKGPATIDAVEIAAQQRFVLDSGEGAEFWYLLFHSSEDGLWAELSCPRDLSEDDEISDWAERILLGQIDPNGGPPIREREPSGPQSGINVEVRRKTA